MDTVDRIRAFSRTLTGRLGVLRRSYLNSGFGLAEARVLHDLDTGAPVKARDLVQSLGIDEAQLSRMLAGFERQALVTRCPAPEDARRRDVVLTPKGRETAARLRAGSRAEIAHLIAPLTPFDKARLGEALALAEGLLSGGTAGRVEFRDLVPGDAGWIVQRHAELYARDEGFDGRFEPLVAEILATYLRGRDRSCERAWIATCDGARLGCIFCVRGEAGRAKLRLFLIEPAARGMGLGQRMLDLCLRYARDRGYGGLTLWTHESHRAACALYRKAGLRIVAEKPVHSFGQALVEQTWAIDF